MSQRGDEVEAAVHPVVHDVPAVQPALVVQVALELVVDVGDDGAEAVWGRGTGGHSGAVKPPKTTTSPALG